MWSCHYEGATPGKRKQEDKKTVEDQREKRAKYEKENRPDRSFNMLWCQGRPWLQYDSDKKVMTCSLCIEQTRKTSHSPSVSNLKNKHLFISGCNNFRLSTVIDHEKSKGHIDAKKIKEAIEKPHQTEGHKTLIKLNEQIKNQVTNKIRNAHAIIKHNRPIKDFMWLNELDKAKGLDFSQVYNNQSAATQFIESIAAVETEKLQKLLPNVKFFSLTMDGSTDDASVEQETLFFRSCMNGQIITKFICIGEPDSTCSDDLYKFVNEKLGVFGFKDHMSKLVGFGSDGASNMTGQKRGLVTQLRHDHPEMIGIHCLAHRLELSFKDVVKREKCYDQLTTLMLGIYYLYKRSPKQRKLLKQSFKVLKVKGTLPHRVGGSRWMPHMKRALSTVFTGYRGYMAHLETQSHSLPKAEGLAKLLGNYNLMVFATVLFEFLDPLVRLSLNLQSPSVTLGDVLVMVEATKDVLKMKCETKSETVKQLEETKAIDGHSLRVYGKPTAAEKILKTLSTVFLETIVTRFQDLSEDLKAAEIASIKNWPTEFDEYGNDHVVTLAKHFSETLKQQGYITNEICVEWMLLKSTVYKRYGQSMSTVPWEDICKSCEGFGVDNILGLIDLIRSLPPTSVLNETSFNQMKLIKSDRRHKLTETHLNACMMIRLESPEISDFNPIPAVENWMVTASGQRRRPNYRRLKVASIDREVQNQGLTAPLLSEESQESVEELQNVGSQEEMHESDEELSETESIDNDSESDIEQSEELNEKMINKLRKEIELEIERDF